MKYNKIEYGYYEVEQGDKIIYTITKCKKEWKVFKEDKVLSGHIRTLPSFRACKIYINDIELKRDIVKNVKNTKKR
jgi:hypothetical protein